MWSLITEFATLMRSMIFDKKEFVLVDRSMVCITKSNSPHRTPEEYGVLFNSEFL